MSARKTTVRRAATPAATWWGPRLPFTLLTDRKVSAEAVRLYAYLDALADRPGEVDLAATARDLGLGDWMEGYAARLQLEEAGWLLVVRGEGEDTLVVLRSRNTDPAEAIRQAMPEGTRESSDSPRDALKADSAVA